MCRKSIGRPMSQQSGALCSAIDVQCQRVRLSVRAALAACVRSEHVPAVVRKRLSNSLCYRSALCDGLAAHWRVMCASSSLAARRACDVLRSVCTKCVCVCPLCASVSIVRCTPVLLTRSNRMNNTSWARYHIQFHTGYTMPLLTRVNHGPVTPPPLCTYERFGYVMAGHRAMIL